MCVCVGVDSSSADPASDYCAPCEEWGNYEEPAGGAVSPDVPQVSFLKNKHYELWHVHYIVHLHSALLDRVLHVD